MRGTVHGGRDIEMNMTFRALSTLVSPPGLAAESQFLLLLAWVTQAGKELDCMEISSGGIER